MSYEASFKSNWAAFLKANFPTAAHAAVWSGKSVRQIENYLDEICGPGAALVARALTDPATATSAQKHLGYPSHDNHDARRPVANRSPGLDRSARANGGRLARA